MIFKNPLDKLTIILSSVICLIPVGVSLVMSIVEGFDWTSLIVSIVLVPILAITWALHPQDYEVTAEGIRILRPYKSITIPTSSIQGIQAIETSDLKYSMRLFGSGGFFGYFGLFTNQKLGRYHIYAGNRQNPVLILTEKKKYVLTPTDAAGFIAAVEGFKQA